jgi:GR25 family glycosyltransferase involved in LPS biosynthesis
MIDNLCVKIINLEHRADRREQCVAEFRAIGFSDSDYTIEKAKSLPGQGARGCSLSHARALCDFLYEDDRPFLMVLEDDFEIRAPQSFVASVREALNWAPLWDVLLLAHNIAIPISGSPMANVYRVINAQTTSGYIVGRDYVWRLVGLFLQSAEGLRRASFAPPDSRRLLQHFSAADIVWKQAQSIDRFWGPVPSWTMQRASFSDIEQCAVDYGV